MAVLALLTALANGECAGFSAGSNDLSTCCHPHACCNHCGHEPTIPCVKARAAVVAVCNPTARALLLSLNYSRIDTHQPALNNRTETVLAQMVQYPAGRLYLLDSVFLL